MQPERPFGRPPITEETRSSPRGNRRATAVVPFREWGEVYSELSTPGPAEFKQGDHVTILGPTGGGKTHIALALADLRTYNLFIACKPEDPLIDELRHDGYHITNKLEIPYADHGSGRMEPVFKRVVYWPRLNPDVARKMKPEQLLDAEKAIQKPAVKAAIGYVRLNGKWCLILDESTWICRDLGLQRDVDSALFQFRTKKASIILCGQRPKWAGQYALSMPVHLFLFQTSHIDDSKALGDITGVNSRAVTEAVQHLDWENHEVLYVNTRTREMYRTIAPPR